VGFREATGVDMSRAGTATTRTPVQLAATVVGVVFLVVGIAGFIPGITTDYDTIQFAGHESQAKLFGVFAVSVLHNIVHLAFGVLGLVMAKTMRNAFLYLVAGGVVYLVLWLYGLVVDHDSSANFVPVNTADNWLHLLLGIGMIALGFALGRPARPARGTG
jgi:arginine exporter protein ArgO